MTNDSEKLPRYRLPKRSRRRVQPQAVRRVLEKALRRHGLDKEIARYEFVLHWSEIVGEEIAKRTKAERLRGDTLVVRVSNSAWAQELSFQKRVILQRLKRFTESASAVSDIHFYVGPIS